MQSMFFFQEDVASGDTEPILFDSKLVNDVSELSFDSHWEVIKYNCMLSSGTLCLETIRQWFTLLASIAIIGLLGISVHKLRRTQHGLDFDQLILIAELIKIVIFIFIEFFILMYAGLILCELIQSVIRTVIGSVFLLRFLTMYEYPRVAKVFFFAYLAIILSFDIFLSIDIFFDRSGIACDGGADWQIFTLISVDTIQALLLVISAIIMQHTQDKKNRTLSVLSNSVSSANKDPVNRMQYQMKLLAYFYVICTCCDWLIYLTGQATIRNKQILCYNKEVLLVNSNLGALYMLCFALASYLYALFMWYTFYNVPKKYGIVSRHNVEDLDMMIGDVSTDLREENLKSVVRALEYDRKFTKSQTKLGRQPSDCSAGGQIINGSTIAPSGTESNGSQVQRDKFRLLGSTTEMGEGEVSQDNDGNNTNGSRTSRKLSDNWLYGTDGNLIENREGGNEDDEDMENPNSQAAGLGESLTLEMESPLLQGRNMKSEARLQQSNMSAVETNRNSKLSSASRLFKNSEKKSQMFKSEVNRQSLHNPGLEDTIDFD